jgi:hypothetical protein
VSNVAERVFALGPTHRLKKYLDRFSPGEPGSSIVGDNCQKDRMAGEGIATVAGHGLSMAKIQRLVGIGMPTYGVDLRNWSWMLVSRWVGDSKYGGMAGGAALFRPTC